MPIQQQLIQAIQNLHRIRIVYRNQPGGRLLEPHALYFLPGSNELCLDAFQMDGYSSKGLHQYWRTFKVADISEVEETAERFPVRAGYDPERSRYQAALANVVWFSAR